MRDMDLTIPLAVTALILIYLVIGRSVQMTLLSASLDSWRRFLSIGYFNAVLWAVWSGFGIATFGEHLKWLRFIGLGLGLILGLVVGKAWARYHTEQAHVDEEATDRMFKEAAEIREVDESTERLSMQLTTVPRLPAWKVLLLLAGLQALGALAGVLVVRYH